MNNQLKEILENKEEYKQAYVFDMDGTLTEARFGSKNILSCKNNDNDLLIRNFNEDLYKDIKYDSIISNVFKEKYLNNEDVFVLSQVHDGIEVINKVKSLNKHFKVDPMCKDASDYFIGTISRDQKFEFLKNLSKYYNNILYIDDSLDNLIYFEDSFNSQLKVKGPGFCDCELLCYHTSSFYTE